jgi:hypothetical protein
MGVGVASATILCNSGVLRTAGSLSRYQELCARALARFNAWYSSPPTSTRARRGMGIVSYHGCSKSIVTVRDSTNENSPARSVI